MAYFTQCFACRKIWCKAKTCDTPHCKEECQKYFDARGFRAKMFKYDFCGRCQNDEWEEFKKQISRKPRLRLEGKCE